MCHGKFGRKNSTYDLKWGAHTLGAFSPLCSTFRLPDFYGVPTNICSVTFISTEEKKILALLFFIFILNFWSSSISPLLFFWDRIIFCFEAGSYNVRRYLNKTMSKDFPLFGESLETFHHSAKVSNLEKFGENFHFVLF
jgi:hypothetical protein